MYARDLFTGIGNNWATGHYASPAGTFGGLVNGQFQASVLFMPAFPFQVDTSLWGNYDPTGGAQKGWEIGLTAAGLLRARYGTGVGEVSVTYDPLGRLVRRWCLATIVLSNSATADLLFFINGSQVAQSVAGAAMVPGVGAARAGNSAAGDAAFNGYISGMAYSEGPSFGFDPFAEASEVARTGQVGLDIFDDAAGQIQKAANAWQVPFFNLNAGPVWAPMKGTTPLTRVGDQPNLHAQALSSNAWF